MLMAECDVSKRTDHAGHVRCDVGCFKAETAEDNRCDDVWDDLTCPSNENVCEDVSLEILKLEVDVVVSVDASDPLDRENKEVDCVLTFFEEVSELPSLDLRFLTKPLNFSIELKI